MTPRSNRPRRSRPEDPEEDLGRALYGLTRVETKRGGSWNVRQVPAASALKEYSCPGCSLVITPGTPHVVAWRADGLMGEADDLAARRHWHAHCWRIG